MITNRIGVKHVCSFCGVLHLVLMVCHCSGQLPPDPNNAALLYYQAFLLCPDADSAARASLQRLTYGGEPDSQIRDYLQQCRDAIKYTERATRIPNCDWGVWYSLGFSCDMPHMNSVRLISHILHVDARALAANADYRTAFERSLTMRRIARQVGTETVHSYLLAMGTENAAQRSISQILGSMPPDVETITWLKDQLAAVPPVSRSPAGALRMDFELALQTARVHPDTIMAMARRHLSETPANGSVRSLSHEELLACMRKLYTPFLDSALGIIMSDMPYEKAYVQISTLMTDLDEQVRNDPVGVILRMDIMSLAEVVLRCYASEVHDTAHLNAFAAALELYLEWARTRQLPATLPNDLPRDPYSGKGFIYTVTEDGFVLRPRVQPNKEPRPLQFEFTTWIPNKEE